MSLNQQTQDSEQRGSIAVLISGSGSNLQAIIDACQNNSITANVVAVIANRPQAGGIQRASSNGIATHCIDHTEYVDREAFDTAVAGVIDQYNPDLVVLAGFMRILSDVFVTKYLGKLLNIHPSLLPKYPGLNTHQRAIDAGDKLAGTTVHFVTAELDGGPAIIQASVPIQTEDSAESLAVKVQRQEHRIYPQAIGWFIQGQLQLHNGTALLNNEPLTMARTMAADNEPLTIS